MVGKYIAGFVIYATYYANISTYQLRLIRFMNTEIHKHHQQAHERNQKVKLSAPCQDTKCTEQSPQTGDAEKDTGGFMLAACSIAKSQVHGIGRKVARYAPVACAYSSLLDLKSYKILEPIPPSTWGQSQLPPSCIPLLSSQARGRQPSLAAFERGHCQGGYTRAGFQLGSCSLPVGPSSRHGRKSLQ